MSKKTETELALLRRLTDWSVKTVTVAPPEEKRPLAETTNPG